VNLPAPWKKGFKKKREASPQRSLPRKKLFKIRGGGKEGKGASTFRSSSEKKTALPIRKVGNEKERNKGDRRPRV